MKCITSLILVFALPACAVQAYDPPLYDSYGKPGSRILALEPTPANDRINWEDGCKDGFASSPGELAWSVDDDEDHMRRHADTR